MGLKIMESVLAFPQNPMIYPISEKFSRELEVITSISKELTLDIPKISVHSLFYTSPGEY